LVIFTVPILALAALFGRHDLRRAMTGAMMRRQRSQDPPVMAGQFEVNLPLFGISRTRSNQIAPIDAASEKITTPKARHSGSPQPDSINPVDFYRPYSSGAKARCDQLQLLRGKPS
jgi:hypothetical protein